MVCFALQKMADFIYLALYWSEVRNIQSKEWKFGNLFFGFTNLNFELPKSILSSSKCLYRCQKYDHMLNFNKIRPFIGAETYCIESRKIEERQINVTEKYYTQC